MKVRQRCAGGVHLNVVVDVEELARHNRLEAHRAVVGFDLRLLAERRDGGRHWKPLLVQPLRKTGDLRQAREPHVGAGPLRKQAVSGGGDPRQRVVVAHHDAVAGFHLHIPVLLHGRCDPVAS